MMTLPHFPTPKWLGAFLLAALATSVLTAQQSPAQPAPGSLEDQQVRVQITELGLLRTLIMISPDSADVEGQVRQKFVDRDFEVYTDAEQPEGRVTSADMRAAGEAENADLVVYARIVEDRQRSNASGFRLFEATASVQVFNRLTGREVASKQVRANGVRHPDAVDARRSAREKAMEQAAHQAIEASLAGAHKILVHHAVIVNVFSDSGLLAIMEYMGKMQGIYHVKRLSFDRRTNEALIEIIGAPQSQTFWRAYLEKLPKTKVNVQVTPNDKLHNKYPDWFLPPAK